MVQQPVQFASALRQLSVPSHSGLPLHVGYSDHARYDQRLLTFYDVIMHTTNPLLPLTYENVWTNLIPDLNALDLEAPVAACPWLECQPRLANALQLFLSKHNVSPWLVMHGTLSEVDLTLLAEVLKTLLPAAPVPQEFGYAYCPQRGLLLAPSLPVPAEPGDVQPIAASRVVVVNSWVEHDELFGSICATANGYRALPGLLHQANGGGLVLPISTLHAQPMLWQRLKRTLQQQRHVWTAASSRRPLPCPVESMPLTVRLLLIADPEACAAIEAIDPNWQMGALRAEVHTTYELNGLGHYQHWIQYAKQVLASRPPAPRIDPGAWSTLIRAGMRWCQDQQRLPLDPYWLLSLVWEAAADLNGLRRQEEPVTSANILSALYARQFRTDLALKETLSAIDRAFITIHTEGSEIGQTNALAVVSTESGASFGTVTRISCVIQPGEGEISDIDRKVELGGSLHAKGVLTLQAYLGATLELGFPLPFSASIVSEQAYDPFDGDSASLAELCALLSAIAKWPLQQSIAITGAVDQLGSVQAVGGINEKIEGFFALCEARGFPRHCGVIFPASNSSQIVLPKLICAAVKGGAFTLWPVAHIAEAMPLLSDMLYASEEGPSLLGLIKTNILRWHQNLDGSRTESLLSQLFSWWK